MVATFMSIESLVSTILGWMFSLIGVYGRDDNPVDVKFLLGFLLQPFMLPFGVPWDDCSWVAEILGIKTILNEFVAFNVLGHFYKKFRDDCDRVLPCTFTCGEDVPCNGSYTINSAVSLTIACFITCGFANFGSIGITIGGLSPMLPEDSVVKKYIINNVLTSMLLGAFASILSGL